MTTSEYAQKVADLIDARPKGVDLDKLMYEIYVRTKIAEAQRDRDSGRWASNEQVMGEMWEKVYSKSAGQGAHKTTSTKSSKK